MSFIKKWWMCFVQSDTHSHEISVQKCDGDSIFVCLSPTELLCASGPSIVKRVGMGGAMGECEKRSPLSGSEHFKSMSIKLAGKFIRALGASAKKWREAPFPES